MDLVKSYPWTKQLGVSDKDFKAWQSKGGGKSFAFWSLENKKINQKKYFDWAVEHYQLPFLEGEFFEKHLMTKSKWEKIKDLYPWSEDCLPVSVWEDAVFIGCVEPPSLKDKKLDFNHYFVLTNAVNLKTIWKVVQSLERIIKEDTQITKLKEQTQKSQAVKSVKLQNSPSPLATFTPEAPPTDQKKPLSGPFGPSMQKGLKPAENKPISLQSGIKPAENKPISLQSGIKPAENKPISLQSGIKPIESKATALKEDVKPAEDKPISLQSGIKPIGIKQPALQNLKLAGNDLDSKKPETHSEKSEINLNVLKVKAEFPEPEGDGERVVESPEETFPGRIPPEEDNDLGIGNLQLQSPTAKEEDSEFKEEEAGAEEFKELTCSEEKTKTVGIVKVSTERKRYDDLWEQVKSVFIAALILDVRGNQVVFPSLPVFYGRVVVKDKRETLVKLEDHSLFNVIRRGHPYHGFVVDTSANKHFFQRIGWQNYPRHVTAIPIKDEKQELKQIFVALSVNLLSRDQIKDIEETVSDSFQSQKTKVPQAA